MSDIVTGGGDHAVRMDRMYRYQRHVYDLTRKYYLFGRDTLIDGLDVPAGGSVLDVGCGTGRNLALIRRRYPRARLFGLDISREMLATAERKLTAPGLAVPRLCQADATAFSASTFGETGFDRIVISYALSMIPDWEGAIDAAIAALNPGGSLHIADFGQQERLPLLVKRGLQGWLARFHVTPRAGLNEALRQRAVAHGAQLRTQSIGRGYAWIAVYKAPLVPLQA